MLTRLSGAELRRFRYNKLARAAGLDLPGSECWVLCRLARQGATPGPKLAAQAGVTVEEGHPVAEDMISKGLITRSPDGVLALTPAGERTAEKLFAAARVWLCDQLTRWSPEQHADLEQVLTKLSRALLGDEADRHLLDREQLSAAPASGPLLSRTNRGDSQHITAPLATRAVRVSVTLGIASVLGCRFARWGWSTGASPAGAG